NDPARRRKRALRKPGAILRVMRELELLTMAREDQAVIADDVAASHDAEADRASRPRAGVTLPRKDCDLLEIDAAARRDGATECERGSARSIDLLAVVGLVDLGVVVLVERTRCEFRKPQQHIHPETH